MIYFQLVTAIFGFGSQLLKWLAKVEERKLSAKEKCEKIKVFKGALKNANKTGDSSQLEYMFSMLRADELSNEKEENLATKSLHGESGSNGDR